MPTYAMIIALNASTLVFTPFNVKMSVVLVVATLTFLLPLLAMSLMYRMGYISGFALKNRERTQPSTADSFSVQHAIPQRKRPPKL